MCPIYHRSKRDKASKEQLRLTTARIKMFVWNAKTESAAISGYSFISEFSPIGVGLYLKEKIPSGSLVRVAHELETATTFRGMVMWANQFSFKQSFVGSQPHFFRMGIRYLFGSEAERQRYLKYLNEMRSRALVLEPGMKF